MIVILQRKRYRNFIQLIFRQNILDIFYPSNHFNALINRPAGNPVIQYSPDHITPLGICIDSGNIFFCCPGIAHKKNIF